MKGIIFVAISIFATEPTEERKFEIKQPYPSTVTRLLENYEQLEKSLELKTKSQKIVKVENSEKGLTLYKLKEVGRGTYSFKLAEMIDLKETSFRVRAKMIEDHSEVKSLAFELNIKSNGENTSVSFKAWLTMKDPSKKPKLLTKATLDRFQKALVRYSREGSTTPPALSREPS